jgi:hypothetical protein
MSSIASQMLAQCNICSDEEMLSMHRDNTVGIRTDTVNDIAANDDCDDTVVNDNIINGNTILPENNIQGKICVAPTMGMYKNSVKISKIIERYKDMMEVEISMDNTIRIIKKRNVNDAGFNIASKVAMKKITKLINDNKQL